MDAALKVRGLAAGYAPGVPAIEGVDLDVAGGHSVAVLGPNGGGKTTLFRALLGQTPWRRGEVVVRGSLAYVPQTERSRLDFPIDALGVVLMGRYRYAPWYRRLGRDDRRAAREALAATGMRRGTGGSDATTGAPPARRSTASASATTPAPGTGSCPGASASAC